VLERVGLGSRVDERVSSYSLGMRQRLGIARCLLNDPGLLILDEPMNGLDPAGIQEFRTLIRGFVDEGRTVLLSSHLLDEVERTCDTVAIIDRGQLIRQGRLDEIRDGQTQYFVVACDEVARALAIVEHEAGVRSVELRSDGSLLIAVENQITGAFVNRSLVLGDVLVTRLEPLHITLEERFLDITSRLQNPEEATA
jgi:ABC-2 type transport system ATP-binding protein